MRRTDGGSGRGSSRCGDRLSSGGRCRDRLGSGGRRGRGGGGSHSRDGGGDLLGSRVLDEEVLSEDAALGVVQVVAQVALAGAVVEVSGLEGAGLEGRLGVAPDGRDLLGELERDGLVDGSGVGGRGVLMSLDRGDPTREKQRRR